jgi:hypothetical protein
MKRTGRGEATGAVIHMYENNTRKSICYFYLDIAKYHIFLFIFIFYVFSSTKLNNRSVEHVLHGRYSCHQPGGELQGK